MAPTTDKQTILVVDDTPDNITLLCGLLGDQYKNKVATNGQKALQIAFAEPHPDLILLDIMMPGMDGYEVCRQLQANPPTSTIPVIFLTAKSQDEDETKGFELGAVDYITKPITPAILMARVQTHLALKQARSFLQEQNDILEDQVRKRTRQLEGLQDALIISMASLVETRDNETDHHIRRTQYYIHELAKHLADHPKFAGALTPKNIELIYKTAPLHDIGKVGVPDRILLKPGRLNPEEFEEMKRHTLYGRDALDAAARRWARRKPSSIPLVRSPITTMKNGTGPVTRKASPGKRSQSRPGSWPSLTCTTRLSAAVRTRNPWRTSKLIPSSVKAKARISTPMSWMLLRKSRTPWPQSP